MPRKGISEIDRYWSKVDKKNDNECWLWLASKDKDGYGWFTLKENHKTIQAHRYSALLKYIDLQNKLVRHTCDNPSCVNPNHLILGSPKDNSKDMIERNRSLIGELNPNSKATNAQASDIIEQYERAIISGQKYGILERLAKKHNLSKQIIYRITSGQQFKKAKI